MRTLLCVLMLAARPAWAGFLTAQGASVLDVTGAQRTTFSNNELIAFTQKVYNSVASANRIQFSFLVFSPSGHQVFTQTGNSVPGTVGNAASALSGIPISGFYTGPGAYTFKGQTSLDAQTITQQVTFVISSPNIILIYPPNGSRNLADSPLTFRWTASGASQYRVTVGDNPSFYNSVFSQTTVAGETFLSYPVNPTDTRQRLSNGTVYYWKVEGLDANGNTIATTPTPWNFSVQQMSLTRDVAVTAVDFLGPGSAGMLNFHVQVANQGGTNESNIPLRFSLAGLPAPGTPIAVSLNTGQTQDFTFAAALPPGEGENLAIACLDLFDDNPANNCKTLRVAQPSASGGGQTLVGNQPNLTPDQMWQAIRQLLQDQGLVSELDQYNFVGFGQNLSPQDLAALLKALRQGQVQVTLNPIATLGPPQGVAPATPGQAPEEGNQEWSGRGLPLGRETHKVHLLDGGAWGRLWKRLGKDKAPTVDFKKYMVVGVVAGSTDRADRVQIDSVRNTPEGIVVRYRKVVQERLIQPLGPQRAALQSSVPYHMMAVPISTSKVKFEEIEDNGGE